MQRIVRRFLAVAGLVSSLVCVWGQEVGPSHSAVIPVPREGGALDRHRVLNERVKAAEGRADLLFIGDSITQGWEGAGKEVWARYYGHRRALNLGIGGDRTQHVLWRFENGNLEGLNPKAAVIMIGTNNSGDNRNTPGEIVDGVTAVVRRLRERFPNIKVLLLAIFPRGEAFNDHRGRLLQVNQALERLAEGNAVESLDFGHRYVNADGTIPKALMPDYLHLSPAGYSVWAESIEPWVARVMGDAPVAAVRRAGE